MSLRSASLARWRALTAARRRGAAPFVAGHTVRLLQSGQAFFPALEQAIDGARESVRLETYIFNDDPSGRRIAWALARAAERGVRVLLVVDGFGTGTLGGELTRLLSRPSIELRVFRPLARWRLERRALRRLHRKLALIDGTIAFVGGINLIDDHEDQVHGRLDAPRLDFALRVEGPLVAPLLASMRRVWSRAQAAWRPIDSESSARTGEARRAEPLTPAKPPHQTAAPQAGPVESSGHQMAQGVSRVHENIRAAFVERDNWRHRRTIERAYLRAIGRARQEIWIACAYFFPGRRFRRALVAAADRGVRVRLLLQGKIEYRLAHFGTLALYDQLLNAGVEIIEYRSSFLHAKLAVADQWLTVGSSNIDPFSLLLAREANVVLRDAGLASELREALERIVAEGGEPVHRAHLQNRPWWMRFASFGAYVLLRIGVALSGKGLRY